MNPTRPRLQACASFTAFCKDRPVTKDIQPVRTLIRCSAALRTRLSDVCSGALLSVLGSCTSRARTFRSLSGAACFHVRLLPRAALAPSSAVSQRLAGVVAFEGRRRRSGASRLHERLELGVLGAVAGVSGA